MRAASFLGGLDDLGRDDLAMRLCNLNFVQFAGDCQLNQVSKLEGNLCYFGGRDRGLEVLASVLRQD